MEIKLGSVPLFASGELLEVFHVSTLPDSLGTYLVQLQVRREGDRSTWTPFFLTPAAARALAALLTLPVQTP